MENLENQLFTATKLLQNCDYKQVLKRGFALIKDANGNLITSLQNVKNKEIIEAEISDGKFSAVVVAVCPFVGPYFEQILTFGERGLLIH